MIWAGTYELLMSYDGSKSGLWTKYLIRSEVLITATNVWHNVRHDIVLQLWLQLRLRLRLRLRDTIRVKIQGYDGIFITYIYMVHNANVFQVFEHSRCHRIRS
jgi:hypothetical protein